jgi:hypothetical protein
MGITTGHSCDLIVPGIVTRMGGDKTGSAELVIRRRRARPGTFEPGATCQISKHPLVFAGVITLIPVAREIPATKLIKKTK